MSTPPDTPAKWFADPVGRAAPRGFATVVVIGGGVGGVARHRAHAGSRGRGR